jgi:hypothetical protein
MRFLSIRFLLFLLVPVHLALPLIALQSENNVNTLARQSTFIFVGTVEKLNATTMKSARASETTVVVRVNKVIEAPGAPPDLPGKSITVQILHPGSFRVGEQATFFTKGWLLGNSMAVIEVGHLLQAQGAAASVQQAVGTAHQQMADEQLQNEVSTSDAIVSGTVRAVHPAKVAHIGSEHDPDWYEAEIAVTTPLRGKTASETVTVLFPHSDDVMWHNSPKFKEGERGVWLLHRNQVRLPGIEDQYTALRALDFQQQNQIERVQRLLKVTNTK